MACLACMPDCDKCKPKFISCPDCGMRCTLKDAACTQCGHDFTLAEKKLAREQWIERLKTRVSAA